MRCPFLKGPGSSQPAMQGGSQVSWLASEGPCGHFCGYMHEHVWASVCWCGFGDVYRYARVFECEHMWTPTHVACLRVSRSFDFFYLPESLGGPFVLASDLGVFPIPASLGPF